MTWARIDDNAPLHPKLMDAGADGAWLWVCGLCHANRAVTNGIIAKRHLTALYPPLAAKAKRLAKRLVEIGLWIDRSDHFEINDYEQYQGEAMRDAVEERREKARVRKRRQRQREVGERDADDECHGVTGRDSGRDKKRDSHGEENVTSQRDSRVHGRGRDPGPARPGPSKSAAAAPARNEPAPRGKTATELWARYEALADEHGLPARPRMPGDEQAIYALFDAGWLPGDIEQGIAAVAARAAEHPSEREWWDGKRTWRPEVMRAAMAKVAGGAPASGTKNQARQKPGPPPDRILADGYRPGALPPGWTEESA